MSPFWRGIITAGAFTVGVAVVALLAVIAYALVSGDGDGPGADVARITQTATASPTATATPVATLSPTASPPTPSPEPEQPTPLVIIVREEAPPPTVEQALPAPSPSSQSAASVLCGGSGDALNLIEEVVGVCLNDLAASLDMTRDELAANLNRMCSDARVIVELYDILVPDLVTLGMPLPPEDVRRDTDKNRAFIAVYCQGQGLTPVPSQALSLMCSEAGEMRGAVSYRDEPVAQKALARLDGFIAKYCGG